ncbi:hypothetical protein GCM10023310_16950 [Paenibacillus vulneris]|uniref:Anti-repressor SinI family protein n=1 Tax=Paenibacillus vulneris TaxID=1133364 RepID=A0ABW3UIM4_9BACL|nr:MULTISPECIES: anti-repressor SinI family protein [unclassified Paenibacillus]MBE1444696.1 DNA-binding transcriptional MerR regulator [Paenibacillus sp. OAS669]
MNGSIVNLMNMEELDREWTDLIRTARKQGLSAEAIRTFLRNPGHFELSLHPSMKSYAPVEAHEYLEAK